MSFAKKANLNLKTKEMEIVWARPEEFEGVEPFEGGMHFMMSLFWRHWVYL